MSLEFSDCDSETLGRGAAGIALIVRKGFLAAGGPSPEVDDAIRREAARWAERRRTWSSGRFAWRRLAVAAGLLILLGGAFLFDRAQWAMESGQRASAEAGNRVALDKKAEDTSSLAGMLLDIQGLDEDSYFTAEAAEALWL